MNHRRWWATALLVLAAGAACAPAAAAPPAPTAAVSRRIVLERARQATWSYPRIDRLEAKLVTLAEWGQASAAAPRPPRPTAAPGTTPVPAPSPDPRSTAAVAGWEPERWVWVVAVGGEVRTFHGQPTSWEVLLVDAATGQPLGSQAGTRGPWPPYFDRLPDHAPAEAD